MAVAGEEIWKLNAYNHIVSKDAIEKQAVESDVRRQNGEPLSLFDGIPVSIKSNIAEQSLPLTAGSAMLGHGNSDNESSVPPCGYDADTVRILLRKKGGICMGLTSMDEFGMGSLGTNIPHGRHVKNPLPFLRHLRLDDGVEEQGIAVGGAGTFEKSHNDDRWTKILQLSPEIIAEKHHEALEAFQKHEGKNLYYSPGGSSSGSAVSVAHGSSLVSLGTDTGGSIRLPAAWCGLVGLKPSYGLLSRHGVVSYASSFDTVGVLANSVDCAASALDILAQRNIEVSRDSTFSCYNDDDSFAEISMAQSIMASNENESNDAKPLSGIKVGIPASFSVKECPEDIRNSWAQTADALHRQGAEIVQISTDDISPALVQRALSAYYVLVSAEASSNLSRYDGFRYGVAAKKQIHENIGDESDHANNTDANDMTTLERQYSASRRQGFGAEVSKRILCGASVLSSDKFHSHYEAAAKLRAALTKEMSSVLDTKADVLLIPTVLSLPPEIDDLSKQQHDDSSSSSPVHNNTAMFANDVMTVPASLAGLPAISIPVPIHGEETFVGGMQLVASRLNESVLLKSANALQ